MHQFGLLFAESKQHRLGDWALRPSSLSKERLFLSRHVRLKPIGDSIDFDSSPVALVGVYLLPLDPGN